MRGAFFERLKAQIRNEAEDFIISVQPIAKSGAPSGMGGIRKKTNPTTRLRIPKVANMVRFA